MGNWKQAALLLSVLFAAGNAAAEEVYVAIPLAELTYPEARPPSAGQVAQWDSWRYRSMNTTRVPSVTLSTGGEGYLLCPEPFNWWNSDSLSCANGSLALKLQAATDVAGSLRIAAADAEKVSWTKFTISKEMISKASRPKPVAKPTAATTPGVGGRMSPEAIAAMGPRDAFYLAKDKFYSFLMEANIAGTAWFRHEASVARLARGEKPAGAPSNVAMGGRTFRTNSLEDTFDLFSGGRAISENLQLDRSLLLSESGEETVDVASIPGITVSEIDWAPLIKNAKPETDLLARSVPSDQYALFFPSLTAMISMMDEAQKTGGEVLSLLEVRAEDAAVRERYQAQLCLPLSEFTRVLGPALIRSVALTGSDPYFRTGTDFALLMDAAQKDAVVAYISARYAAAKAAAADAQVVNGTAEGVSYSGVVTPDRRLSSYLAVLDSTVVVSNSRIQLERVIAAAKGKQAALASLGEYTFFRDRYRKSDAAESGLLIVPDAAIRKWGGPTWRIGDSRRSRAAAMLSELQAATLQRLVKGELAAKDVRSDALTSVATLGELSIEQGGIRSSKYGTLAFLTPISELGLSKVSEAEKTAYGRFRDTYSSYWRGYFDPIGLRFTLVPGERGMDLTVMPLIVGTDYRTLMQFAQTVVLDEFTGDLHNEALLTVTAAVDSSAPWTNFANNQSRMFLPGLQNPLSWIGKSLTVFLDQSPIWEEAQKAEHKDRYLESNYQRLPIGLFVEVQDSLKLTAVLSAIRSFVEQGTPGMTVWDALTFEGVPYVKVHQALSPVAAAREPNRQPWAIYYAATPEALILTLQEDVLKRAISRLKNRTSDAAKAMRKFAVGSQAAIVASKELLKVAQGIGGEDYAKLIRLRCWGNIPILNEWKRLFPDRDPVAVHESVWKSKLVCPAGGEYVWNAEWGTMESTVLGHPGAPRASSGEIPTLSGVERAALAVGFENNGLRARVQLVNGTPTK